MQSSWSSPHLQRAHSTSCFLPLEGIKQICSITVPRSSPKPAHEAQISVPAAGGSREKGVLGWMRAAVRGAARGGSQAEGRGGFALHQEKELHIWSRGQVLQLGLRSRGAAVSGDGHLTRCLSAGRLNPGQEIKSRDDRGFYLLLRCETTTGISTTTHKLQRRWSQTVLGSVG